jgi:hypothetical protein
MKPQDAFDVSYPQRAGDDEEYLRLTLRKAAHISAPPETNGVTERRHGLPSGAGFQDPRGAPPIEGLDPRVVCSMHRLLGKGYAGGGDHQLWPSGWTVFSSSLVRDPGLWAGG